MYSNVKDTLVAHHAYAAHWPQRLDQLVSELCDAAPWKIVHGMRDAGDKGHAIEIMGGEELALYNGQDARLTALCAERMAPLLAPERAVYEHDLRLAHACFDMAWAGIGVDAGRRAELMSALTSEIAEHKAALVAATRKADFEPARLEHVRWALRSVFRAPVVRTTPAGELSTNDETLEELIGPGGDTPLVSFCETLLEWRYANKILSTYLEPAAPNPRTGRCHFGWKVHGTVSGRLAGRYQSVPRYSARSTAERVKEIYVPAKGKRYVYFDVSQAEMRLAAYLSADPVFMRVASTSDVHAGNARMVFPEVAAKGWLDSKEAKSDPERGKPYRDIAKNLGFAIAYGAEEERVYMTLRRKGFGVTMAGIRLILSNLRLAYRVYYKWVESNVARVREAGYMRSPILGRLRVMGTRCPSTEVANFPVQSALADIVNARMIALQARIRAGEFPGVDLVAQVHDACVYESPIGEEARLEDAIDAAWAESVALAGGPLVLPIDRKRGERMSEL